jgi:hypothetical protein
LVEHLVTTCRPDYVYGLSKDENGISRICEHRTLGDSMDQSMMET